MFSDHLSFLSAPQTNLTAPYSLTHRFLRTLYTPTKERFLVNILHHGDWAYLGTGRPQEKTHRNPSNGMRSKSGAVRRSFTPPSCLLSTLRICSAPFHIQTGLGWGHSVCSSAVCSWLCT